MRFGKTFTAYQLAKQMGWKKILVLTFKPAVESAWEEDLMSHVDFTGWQFINRKTELTFESADKNRPIVCFGSFQDYLEKNEAGGIKYKNEWVHTTNWDGVVLDEYHYGAWRENAKDLFESEDKREFIEEQIFNWTYSDEQRAKEEWQGNNNPYESLPRMVLLTYQLPDSIREIAMMGEYNAFDLNIFFSSIRYFDLLVSVGVFNSALMNDAVYKFKRYEDASLEYIGINKHEDENVGLFDTVLSASDYTGSFVNEI